MSRMTPFALSAVATGMEKNRASCTISAPAEEEDTPPPATIIGRLDSPIAPNAAVISSPGAGVRTAGNCPYRGSNSKFTLIYFSKMEMTHYEMLKSDLESIQIFDMGA